MVTGREMSARFSAGMQWRSVSREQALERCINDTGTKLLTLLRAVYDEPRDKAFALLNMPGAQD